MELLVLIVYFLVLHHLAAVQELNKIQADLLVVLVAAAALKVLPAVLEPLIKDMLVAQVL
jgi:hypothetical protein